MSSFPDTCFPAVRGFGVDSHWLGRARRASSPPPPQRKLMSLLSQSASHRCGTRLQRAANRRNCPEHDYTSHRGRALQTRLFLFSGSKSLRLLIAALEPGSRLVNSRCNKRNGNNIARVCAPDSAVCNRCDSLATPGPDLAGRNYPGRGAITPTVTSHFQGLLELHSIK